jgi:hypothetical protein
VGVYKLRSREWDLEIRDYNRTTASIIQNNTMCCFGIVRYITITYTVFDATDCTIKNKQ